jgi:tripartite-type tricarboxylate transporter receptor subunit TctC
MAFRESDFTPVIWLSSVPQVVVVHPSLPVRNIKDLIALDKAKPGQLSYGSSGSGAINHLTGELFNSMTGTKLVHVPYKGGGPAAVALLSGEIGMIFGEPASIAQQVKAGRLRAVAVTSAKRSLFLPDLPTVAESGVPGYEVTSWNGVLAPAGTPAEIVRRLNSDLNRIIAAPDMTKRMIEFGFEPVGGPPERFGEFIRAETAKWAPVVKKAGVKVD